VEVLKNEEHRLHPALAQQQMPAGVKGEAATLGSVKRRPLGVVDGHIEQGKDRSTAEASSSASRPVILSRIFAVSSRSCTWKYSLRSSIRGRYGVACV
jgi:hypothetical protein